MVAQDLTKFTVVLVILGVILAVAVFRPKLLPVDAARSANQTVEVEGGTAPLQGRGNSESPSAENKLSWDEEFQQSRRELALRETELDQRQYELDRHQAQLDAGQHELEQRQVELEAEEHVG